MSGTAGDRGTRGLGDWVRPEQPADVAAIRAINTAAFGRDAEARLVDALRGSGASIASLVAVHENAVVGHILFSRVWIENDDIAVPIASLAPMAVLPEFQHRGMGSALVRAGLDVCRRAEYPAVIVVGHPAYYPRFGFASSTVAHLQSPYAGGAFMGLDLQAGFLATLAGTVRYPAAFDGL